MSSIPTGVEYVTAYVVKQVDLDTYEASWSEKIMSSLNGDEQVELANVLAKKMVAVARLTGYKLVPGSIAYGTEDIFRYPEFLALGVTAQFTIRD